MKKRFLGIVCFIYAIIIIYVWSTGMLKNFLAPNMQIYLKIATFPLIMMGIILCLNKKINYKFKISDVVLLLPIVMLLIAGDGRLTVGLANNKNNMKKENQSEEKEEVEEDIEETEVEEIDTSKLDFSKVDFEVKDESYEGLANYITYSTNPDYYVGKTIRVRGLSLKNPTYVPSKYFVIGKYLISCCAADSEFTGFFARYDKSKLKDNTWYEIEGVFEKGKDKQGYDLVILRVVNIKEISSKNEEQYIYPCYSYDAGKCEELSKYDLK